MSSLPPTLKSLGHYLKIANEHSERDPIVYYWCLVYAVEMGMRIDRKAPETREYLGQLLSTLESVKATLQGEEAIKNEIVAQAHLEEYALRLFTRADTDDRQAVFNKNVVKAFYTAAHLMDVLEVFGELDERIAQTRKYAKWKAAHIHSCLRKGVTPTPGPAKMEGEEEESSESSETMPPQHPQGMSAYPPTDASSTFVAPPQPGPNRSQPQPLFAPPQPRCAAPAAADTLPKDLAYPTNAAGVSATAMASASKAARYAQSALEYEDVPTAIKHLREAMALLDPSAH